MNKKVAIIGSDSYIATHFYNKSEQYDTKLFTCKSSGKEDEIVKDLFSLTLDDFKSIDVVINFAAIVHQPEPKDDSEFTRVNTLLPIALAKIAKEAGVKQFIQMSSLGVYGDIPLYEVNSVYNPEGVYGRTKMEADKVLIDLQDDTFKVSLVRPPMVYGGGMSPGNMQKIVRMALKGLPFPVKGLKNQRDVIHVYNLVDALLMIINDNLDGVLLPTDRRSISTEDIINLTDIYSSKRVRKVAFPNLFKSVIAKLKPNLYQKLFGDSKVVCNMPEAFQPKYSLEDGIEELVRGIDNSEFK